MRLLRDGSAAWAIAVVLWSGVETTRPLTAQMASQNAEASDYAVVPRPARVAVRAGTFTVNADTRIALSDPANAELRNIAEQLAASMYAAAGVKPAVAPARVPANATNVIRLALADAGEAEGYRLSASPSRITITARAPAGLFYGTQTLRQLMMNGRTVTAVDITDAPRFSYRGMHLDVARHFQPVSFVKKYIDLLALYKFNTFHWHLTDDQGWRVQISRYPKLTSVGGCRSGTRIGSMRTRPEQYDNVPHCGFYTQDEIRDVVAYAKARHITVLPEIEMPGHASAAIAAYPELGCREGTFQVVRSWGIFEDIFCPKEETFAFLEGVLTEVMQLFPSEYIHVGGDEAPKKSWEESAFAQSVMQREGLKDAHELQSWFIKRIERFLNANGRKLIGWDEIAEGGLSPTATVMYWRDSRGAGLGHAGLSEDPARLAARSGNDVIMTPNGVFYLDHYQASPEIEPLAIGGNSPIEKVYTYDPIPEDFTPEMARRVIGAQANVWTEYIRTSQHVEYMVFPRLLAVAEVVWSPKQRRDFASFTARLSAHIALLQSLNVNARVPRPGEPGGPAAQDTTRTR
jgi:hexosaminidase